MRIVIENLVDNAVKFSSKRAAPEIVIDPQQAADGAGFGIRDNGAGFAMGYAEKLMRVGSRLHAEGDFPGTGIGLAIARRVLEKHGRRLWFGAEEGAGASFFVCLPGNRETSGTL